MIMNKTELLLNEGWKFHFGECEEAWYQGYDDRAFERVMLPHDWAVAYPFSKQYSSGTGYLTGGIGWYRLHFYLPEEYQGKAIRLVFDGVYKNSQVWVNSYYQGKHPYGYTGFSYDISGIAHFGEQENVVSVKVTHTDIADSRWYTGSGITRKVTLVVEEQVHPAEYGVTFVTEKLVADGKEFPEVQAAVSIHHEICNQTKEQKPCVVCTKLSDPQGTPVAEWKEQVQIPAGNTVSCSMHGTIRDPKCWSPEHPDLYGMETWYETTDEDGKKISYLADKQKVGIRVAEFDADRGFFLNGVPMKIKGVCVHHDAGCLGAAVTKEVWHRRFAKLKECGCNAIRCSHNPHMPELYELCDTMGFLVMDEAFDEWENAKNKWSTGHNVYPPKHQGYFEDFPEWHEKDLRAMVRRDKWIDVLGNAKFLCFLQHVRHVFRDLITGFFAHQTADWKRKHIHDFSTGSDNISALIFFHTFDCCKDILIIIARNDQVMGIMCNGSRHCAAFDAKPFQRRNTDLPCLSMTLYHADLVVYTIRFEISVFCRHFLHQMRGHDLVRVHLYHIRFSITGKPDFLFGDLSHMNGMKQLIRNRNGIIFRIIFLCQNTSVLHDIKRSDLL